MLTKNPHIPEGMVEGDSNGFLIHQAGLQPICVYKKRSLTQANEEETVFG